MQLAAVTVRHLAPLPSPFFLTLSYATSPRSCLLTFHTCKSPVNHVSLKGSVGFKQSAYWVTEQCLKPDSPYLSDREPSHPKHSSHNEFCAINLSTIITSLAVESSVPVQHR